MMTKILHIITPGRQSTEALHWSLHKAKESKRMLKVVYIIDQDTANEVQKNLADVGFTGDKQGVELTNALNKEFRERGKKVIEEVEKQCRTFGVSFEVDIKTGNYLEVCESLAKDKIVEIIVVTERKGSFIKKIFEGSELKKLREVVSCEIKAY